MPNNLFVGSGQIEGNISSCKTEITYLNGSSRPSIFYEMNTGYATNNCTGKVDNFESWSLTGFSIFLLIIVAIVVSVVSLKILLDF